MCEIVRSRNFKKSYKKVARSGNFKFENFTEILEHFIAGKTLPFYYHDHQLTGNLFGKRECHLSGDLLLIYQILPREKIIILDNIGNHAQIFNQ